MLKKLLTTRIFANFFNEKAEKFADFFGVWGLVAAYVLSAFAIYLVFVFALGFSMASEEMEDCALNIMDLESRLSSVFLIGIAMFFVRIFAARYRYWLFFALMLLPICFLFCMYGFDLIAYRSFKFTPFVIAEWAIFFFVFFNNHYSHYRAFQLVGSLFLICFALGFYNLSTKGIFLAAVFLFWILSRAHILFRDKLLDYLESKEK